MRDLHRVQPRADQGDVDAMCVLARSLALVRWYDEALKWWWRAAETKPDVLDEAVQYLDEADDVTEWLERAAARSKAAAIEFARRLEPGDRPEAWLERVAKTRHPRPHLALCWHLLDAGQPEAAVRWFARADNRDPHDTVKLIARADAIDKAKNTDVATEVLWQLSELADVTASRLLAARLHATGAVYEAVQLWEFAAERDDWLSLWALVDYYAHSRREADVERVLDKLAPRSPRTAALLRKWRADGGSLAGLVLEEGLQRPSVEAEREFAPRHPPRLDIEERHYLVAAVARQAPPAVDLTLVARISNKDESAWQAGWKRVRSASANSAELVVFVEVDDGLVPVSSLVHPVHLPADGPSEIVRFDFRTTTTGTFRIRLAAWSGGTLLARLETEIEVTNHGGYEHGTPAMAAFHSVQAVTGATSLLVQHRGDRYEFRLLSDSGPFEPAFSTTLAAAPQEPVERTVAMLHHLAGSWPGRSAPDVVRLVKAIGAGLWQDFVPAQIQEQFWRIRDRISSLTVIADHDLLPWELLHPSRGGSDHGFLVEQFPVLRSTPGLEPGRRMTLRPMVYVVPGGSPATAREEVAHITELFGEGETVTDLADLLDRIGSGPGGGLHFACHHGFARDEDGSKVTMPGGDFRPGTLDGAVTGQTLAPASPLVFLNAGRPIGAVPEHIGTSGWARQFVRAGASAFVGTLWPVPSERASAFATAFYRELRVGKSLGAATHQARKLLTSEDDLTWLAYVVYGLPSTTRW